LGHVLLQLFLASHLTACVLLDPACIGACTVAVVFSLAPHHLCSA
jgi:hypothetical protein